MQFGNHGPSLGDFGLTRHYVDKCSTVNNQGHQKIGLANMSGTFNGAPVHSYLDLGIDFIAHNHFVFVDATYRSC